MTREEVFRAIAQAGVADPQQPSKQELLSLLDLVYKFQKLDVDVLDKYIKFVGHQASVAEAAFEALGVLAKSQGDVNAKFQENIREAIRFAQKAYEQAASAEERAEIRRDVRGFIDKANTSTEQTNRFSFGSGVFLGAAVVGLSALIYRAVKGSGNQPSTS
ncbi:MAG: hypothetical protein K0R39_1115 [Symbiobacteriaceae bacterium]|jgi:hypothetical protein|nr:hypothetical protein [Symbiobacteriaceae bacterium]